MYRSMTCLWHGQNSKQFKQITCNREIRVKSYTMDKSKDNENPKIVFKTKNHHLNILITASFKVNSGGNMKVNKRRSWRQRNKIKTWLYWSKTEVMSLE